METNANPAVARIMQWEKMTQADPTNDMGWFSLGSAYKDADRPADAEKALGKAIELNAGMSRAYQLRGQVLIQLGKDSEAAAVLTKGYTVAAERGDVMPQKAIGSLLEKLGKPVPQVKAPPGAPTAAGTLPGAAAKGGLVDRKTGEPGSRMADPPMRGSMGKFIYDHYTQETWRTWIGQGTKVINELRLDFSNDAHQRAYEEQMMAWLGFSKEDVDEYAKK